MANSGGGSGAKTAGKLLIFENRKYREEDFVLPAQDTKGHSERIYYRIQPGWARDLQAILASKKFPFRTVGDIGRVAIRLMIDLLNEMEPMASVSQQVDAIIKLVRDEEFYIEFVGAYELMTKGVNRYISTNETGQARRMVLAMREQIRKMPKGYWRGKYSKELKQKFGHLIGNGSGTGLSEGEEDKEGEDEDGDGDE